MTKQCTDTIMMVRPARFGYNTETAENNVFQQKEESLSSSSIQSKAREEYDLMVHTLRSEGVKIISIADTVDPAKTDAVFSNNWISTHTDGSVYLYPMFSANRRLERREDILKRLSLEYKLDVKSDLLDYESDGLYLESTGSIIFDREHKIIYACLSVRTHERLLNDLGKRLGYEVCSFTAKDADGIPYYHTNVIMTLGTSLAIICTECIVDDDEKQKVMALLERTKKTIIDLTRDQVIAFAGNMLEVNGHGSKPLLVMYQSAYDSLTEDQLHIIKNHNKIVSCSVPTIEKLGGGSVRCMMTEIYLPVLN